MKKLERNEMRKLKGGEDESIGGNEGFCPINPMSGQRYSNCNYFMESCGNGGAYCGFVTSGSNTLLCCHHG